MTIYNNGKIYKIEPVTEHDEGDIYIGSTTKQYLSQRMVKHRKEYKMWKKDNPNVSKTMCFNLFNKYGLENCQIVLIECVNANTYDELQARKHYYIKLFECVNKCCPILNHEEKLERKKEYYKDNKTIINEKSKEYYLDHKEQVKEYNKEYNNKKYTCICGTVCSLKNKTPHLKTWKHNDFIKLQQQEQINL